MARGRIISNTIQSSKRILSVMDSEPKKHEFICLLYTWIIPQTDDFGHFDADARVVRSKVMPCSERPVKDFKKAVEVLESVGLIRLYGNGAFLEITDFENHQTFRSDRKRIAKFPMPNAVSTCNDDGTPETYQWDTVSKAKLSEAKLSEDKLINSLVNTDVVDEHVGLEATKPKPPNCPHVAIIELYHEKLPSLARVGMRKVGGKDVYSWDGVNRSALAARWREDENVQSLEWWGKFFDWISEKKWLMGVAPTSTGWSADLPFIVKKSKFDSIKAGKYNDRKGGDIYSGR